ncbi:hypothetical protein GTY44_04240 [Streptomyces sp. SID5914]|nr:helix-turn-helix domain-containing protein [Streptomyces sp. SID5914]MZG12704.1 hypothetical protein [Streptomyces sp. SID5914]
MEHAWVADLDATLPVEPCCDPATLALARRELGEGAVRWAVAVGHRVTQHIISEVPEHGAGPAPAETMRRAAESAVLACLRVLVHGVTTPYGVPHEGVDAVRDFVRRGMPLDRVLRGTRLGHAYLHQALRDAAPDGLMPEGMTESLFEQVDRMSGELAAAYVAERDRWEGSEEGARCRMVEGILSGEQVDPVTAERVLDYPMDRHHVALILWQEGPGGGASLTAPPLAELLDACGGDESLRVEGHAGAEWVWIGFRARPRGLSWPARLPDGWRACAGPPAFGPEGLRRSHLGARWAARIAEARPASASASAGVCDYRQIRTVSLLTGDTEHARWFVHETLGPLAAPDHWSEQLRETLRCYLASGRSLKTAAQRLGVARNTVTYRVRRAEELLESPWLDPLELRLALEMVQLPGVLDAAPIDWPAEEASGGRLPTQLMYVKAGLGS